MPRKGFALFFLGLLFAATAAEAAEETVRHELAPTGVLRVAIGVGPSAGPFYTVQDRNTGQYRGVTVELARALGARIGVPVVFIPHLGSGEIQNSADAGRWDVTFMPVDAERKRAVDFGAPYHVLQSTYLVAGGLAMTTIAQANTAGVRVVGVKDTATFRASQAASPRATHIAVDGPDRAVALLRSGGADAIALGRESLNAVKESVPGSSILAGAFLNSTTAIAVPNGNPVALAYVTAFIEDAKQSGLVRRAFDAYGLQSSVIAPAGMMP